MIQLHCVKSVRIRRYSGPHFQAVGLNMERYGVSLRIRLECRNMRTSITPNTDTFHPVLVLGSLNHFYENIFSGTFL